MGDPNRLPFVIDRQVRVSQSHSCRFCDASVPKTRLQQTAIDVAAQVLSEVDAVAVWKKLILQQDKPQVVASVMEYLTDRVYGRPAQTIQGNPNNPSRLN